MKTKNEFMKIITYSRSSYFEKYAMKLYETHTCDAGTKSQSAKSKSASSEPFHLMRYKSSPEDLVAPIIRSACKIVCFS